MRFVSLVRSLKKWAILLSKIVGIDDLVSQLISLRGNGETVAFTNGCFDILHVDFLKLCRQQASLLVVGLNSDKSVRLQNKGRGRPINTFDDRAIVLDSLECVDYIVRFSESTPIELIDKIRPNVLIKGEDWADKEIIGRKIVESYGGKIVLLPLVEEISTTKIIERICKFC